MGAGFILYREDPLEIFTLIPNKKQFLYDLPKGTEDPGEDRLETAIRECFEEAGIEVDLQNIEGLLEVDKGRLTLYIAPWQEDWEPIIEPNPETGKIEHLSWEWVSPIEFAWGCAKWMRGAPEKFLRWYYQVRQ